MRWCRASAPQSQKTTSMAPMRNWNTPDSAPQIPLNTCFRVSRHHDASALQSASHNVHPTHQLIRLSVGYTFHTITGRIWNACGVNRVVQSKSLLKYPQNKGRKDLPCFLTSSIKLPRISASFTVCVEVTIKFPLPPSRISAAAPPVPVRLRKMIDRHPRHQKVLSAPCSIKFTRLPGMPSSSKA